MNKAENLVLKYYLMQKEINELSKKIKVAFNDIWEKENLENGCHLGQFYEDSLCHKESFEEYCEGELNMNEPCPDCMKILELIRERKSLRKPFGIIKREIMALGKKIKG